MIDLQVATADFSLRRAKDLVLCNCLYTHLAITQVALVELHFKTFSSLLELVTLIERTSQWQNSCWRLTGCGIITSEISGLRLVRVRLNPYLLFINAHLLNSLVAFKSLTENATVFDLPPRQETSNSYPSIKTQITSLASVWVVVFLGSDKQCTSEYL